MKERKTKTNQTWVWVQTSKNLKNGQSYMYISHYNLKQKKIITLKCVLSEFKERRDFYGVGIKAGGGWDGGGLLGSTSA